MKLALHKLLLGLLPNKVEQDEDDRADVEYLRKARSENTTFRPLRDVLADIEAEERGDLQRSAKQAS